MYLYQEYKKTYEAKGFVCVGQSKAESSGVLQRSILSLAAQTVLQQDFKQMQLLVSGAGERNINGWEHLIDNSIQFAILIEHENYSTLELVRAIEG